MGSVQEVKGGKNAKRFVSVLKYGLSKFTTRETVCMRVSSEVAITRRLRTLAY